MNNEEAKKYQTVNPAAAGSNGPELKRAPGFYWIQSIFVPSVAMYTYFGKWVIFGNPNFLDESEISVLDESPIVWVPKDKK